MLTLYKQVSRSATALLAVSSLLVLAACGEQNGASPKEMQEKTTQTGTQTSISVTGAGASFPAPVYTKWADQYFRNTQHKINYQSIGSSAGVKQIAAHTVDFGASDAPVKPEQLTSDGLFQFPTVIGGVVLAVNVEGIKTNELILNGTVLADIFLGKIKKWDDAAIKKLNPTLKLPNQNISVVRRADGSGTSFVFTGYLAKVSSEWQSKIGSGSTVNWPTGVGGKGNDGVTAFVQRLPGSIGYVEYAYAKQNKLTYTKLISADGEAVSPSGESFSAAAAQADWQKSFAQDLTNQSGANAWPIASTTFIVLHKKQKDAKKAKEILSFFEWGYSEEGKKITTALDYAPLPDSVAQIVREAWKTELTDVQDKAIYP